jgi:hypothetical protein
MLQSFYRSGKAFLTRKVSTEQAITILRRNGISVNSENAEIILEFLYLVARTYRNPENNEECAKLEPKEDIEHQEPRSDGF